MAIQRILGTDTGKAAFTKTDDNFVEVYADVAGVDADLVAHKAESANKAHGGFQGILILLNTGAQSISHDDSNARINFIYTEYAYGNFWDSNFPSRLIIPFGVSKVRLTGSVRWAMNQNGLRRIAIGKNGNRTYRGVSFQEVPADPNIQNMNLCSPVLEVNEGDYFELFVYQNSNGALDLLGSSQTWLCLEVVE